MYLKTLCIESIINIYVVPFTLYKSTIKIQRKVLTARITVSCKNNKIKYTGILL